MSSPRRVPLWMTALIAVDMLPGAALPAMLSALPAQPDDSVRLFLLLYPLYIIATGIIAWQCYGRRTAMTWILLALMLLTHAAMWVLVTCPDAAV